VRLGGHRESFLLITVARATLLILVLALLILSQCARHSSLSLRTAPAGTDENLSRQLRGELIRQLILRANANLPQAQAEGNTPKGVVLSHRLALSPPTGEKNRVDDLSILHKHDGT